MLPFAYYLLKVMLCSSILFGYYWLALRNKKFHLYNRFYLLASVVLSWLIPLIKINFFEETSPPPQIIKLLTAVAGGNRFVEQAADRSAFTWDWNIVLISVFTGISALFAARLLLTVVRIIRLINSNPVERWKQIYFVFTNVKSTPFSFFKYIFWNEEISLNSSEGELILKHELVHVQEKHSADKMFVNLVLIGGWYNPVMWFIQKELNLLHEFIADERAVKDCDAADFAAMLLKAAYPQYSFPLVNSFFYSPIKRRLLMLTSSKKTSYSYLRRIAVLPLLSVTFILFAFSLKNAKTYASPAVTFKSVMEPNSNPTIKDPNEADKDFEDTTKNKKKERSLISSADSLVKTAQLTFIDSTGEIIYITADTIVMSNDTGKLRNELIMVDGNISSYNQLNRINPSQIVRMEILKSQEAIKIYGEKGKNGVIEIMTRAAVEQSNSRQKYMEDQSKYQEQKQKYMEDLSKYQEQKQKYEEDQSKYNILFAKQVSHTVNTEPAKFPGGNNPWRRYLLRNANLNILADHNAPLGTYSVVIGFDVNTDGRILNLVTETNPGYGTEEEVMKLISKGPKWLPAKKDGVFVTSHVKQTISFTLTKDGAYVTVDGIMVGKS